MKILKIVLVAISSLFIILLISCDSKLKKTQKPFRLNEPRLTPLEESQWTEEQTKLLSTRKKEDGSVTNVFTTLVRHPILFDRFSNVTNYVLFEQTLPARYREILILRIGWLCKAKYEFGRHTLIGKKVGLTDEEILRITKGANEPDWSIAEAALIDATDELYNDAIISDATWKTLSEHYTEKQLIDIIFTIGQYNLVSWALNSLGVQLEEGVQGFPEEKK
ncbi:MAG: carboxymuconolactone decarboxylase family protein [bacterium]